MTDSPASSFCPPSTWRTARQCASPGRGGLGDLVRRPAGARPSTGQTGGAEWIHLVDLDAAFGRGSNAELLADVVARVDVKVEMSGGIRDDESLERAMATGCARVNLGTAALENPEWTASAIDRYGDRVAVGLDVRGTTLAARGWTKEGGDLWEVLARLDAAGCARYVVTDVNKDGMLRRPQPRVARAGVRGDRGARGRVGRRQLARRHRGDAHPRTRWASRARSSARRSTRALHAARSARRRGPSVGARVAGDGPRARSPRSLFSDDDGTADARLAQALIRHTSGRVPLAEVVDALAFARVLVPVLASGDAAPRRQARGRAGRGRLDGRRRGSAARRPRGAPGLHRRRRHAGVESRRPTHSRRGSARRARRGRRRTGRRWCSTPAWRRRRFRGPRCGRSRRASVAAGRRRRAARGRRARRDRRRDPHRTSDVRGVDARAGDTGAEVAVVLTLAPGLAASDLDGGPRARPGPRSRAWACSRSASTASRLRVETAGPR